VQKAAEMETDPHDEYYLSKEVKTKWVKDIKRLKRKCIVIRNKASKNSKQTRKSLLKKMPKERQMIRTQIKYDAY
jgi:hypothetical protein